MNFMFEWQEQYLTRLLRSLVTYCSCHSNITFKAELQRAKRASEAPWVRKIGNSSKPRKFCYDVSVRASFRPYRLLGRVRGVSRYSSRSPIRETKECHLSLAVFCLEKSEKHSFLFATNNRTS